MQRASACNGDSCPLNAAANSARLMEKTCSAATGRKYEMPEPRQAGFERNPPLLQPLHLLSGDPRERGGTLSSEIGANSEEIPLQECKLATQRTGKAFFAKNKTNHGIQLIGVTDGRNNRGTLGNALRTEEACCPVIARCRGKTRTRHMVYERTAQTFSCSSFTSDSVSVRSSLWYVRRNVTLYSELVPAL